jgi:hypothetical protein
MHKNEHYLFFFTIFLGKKNGFLGNENSPNLKPTVCLVTKSPLKILPLCNFTVNALKHFGTEDDLKNLFLSVSFLNLLSFTITILFQTSCVKNLFFHFERAKLLLFVSFGYSTSGGHLR